jgi:SAM-dependent methyltransferase
VICQTCHQLSEIFLDEIAMNAMNANVVLEREADEPALTEYPKLHLGCFDQPLNGWVNTDITPHIRVSRIPYAAELLHSVRMMSSKRLAQHQAGIFRQIEYLNLSKKFAYASNSFAAVFTSHVLEHLYPSVAIRCLGECLRVLRPNGVLRISVPDLDRMVRDYDPADPEAFLQELFQYGVGADKNSHHWHYNYTNLSFHLLNLGFSKVTRCDFRIGRCPDAERIDSRPESLFVEAVK